MDPQGHPAEVPAQLFRDSFRALQIEMRANALSKQIRDFAGEGSKRFKEWLNDIDRMAFRRTNSSVYPNPGGAVIDVTFEPNTVTNINK